MMSDSGDTAVPARLRKFAQVDVFTHVPYLGNPVAVVLEADGLTAAQMQQFARWTNLSETTFILPPEHPDADYRLRIFTPAGELPFAGHPTLGSCHAWREAGGVPKNNGSVVQECVAGLIQLRIDGAAPAFQAPPLRKSGPLDGSTLGAAAGALGLGIEDVIAHSWVDNGPGWLGLLVADAQTVLELVPDFTAMGNLRVGVIGPHPAGGPADFEVRAFVPGLGVPEDPVTGSLNAGLAQWLIGAGRAPSRYTVRQGTSMGRRGLVSIAGADGGVWVSGSSVTCITGQVLL